MFLDKNRIKIYKNVYNFIKSVYFGPVFDIIISKGGVFMKFYILQMKVNGIKNISKEIVLNFYNKTFKQEFDLNDSNIKSIYGPNGSGKSGLINAVDIYKKLVINENFLSDSSTTKLLDEMVNKRNNRF